MKAIVFRAPGRGELAAAAGGLARAILPPDVAVHALPSVRGPGEDLTRSLREVGVTPLETTDLVPADARIINLGAGDGESWPLAIAEADGIRDDLALRIMRLAREVPQEPAVAIIGGSGFYDLPGISELREIPIDTPYGATSTPPAVGRLGGKKIVFIARHGKGHVLTPGEVPSRANIYALKRLGVRYIISASAVGSLREEIAPGDIVVPRQFIDRTHGRPGSFFGGGLVGHVSFADPVCHALSETLVKAAEGRGAKTHRGGTLVIIEGPQFSTRAESHLWRSWGADIVGMTAVPEARLAREAEISYATLALPTDYDCWREETEAVTASDVGAMLQRNVQNARNIIGDAVSALDLGATQPLHANLDQAIFTSPDRITVASRVRLHAVLARWMGKHLA